jgi:hypothetical protein
MIIKPIETIYKGYRFRSRLEARWAVFFDALGIEWEYEPEGFEFEDGTRYLPDFVIKEKVKLDNKKAWALANSGELHSVLLAGIETYIEIKPTAPSKSELTKLQKLCEGTGKNCFLLAGVPGKQIIYFSMFDFGGRKTSKPVNGKWFVEPGKGYEELSIVHLTTVFKNFGNLSHSDFWDKGVFLTKDAITAARSARFEHGESG